jgi:hypothetical protein
MGEPLVKVATMFTGKLVRVIAADAFIALLMSFETT